MQNLNRLRELVQRPPTIQELLEAAPVAIIATDEQGRIVLLNRRAEVLFGTLSEDLFGEPVRDLFLEQPDFVEGSQRDLLALRAQEQTPVVARVGSIPLLETRLIIVSLREVS